MELKKGEIVQLEGGRSAKILEKLGEGGQGIVYKVDIAGKKFALKWYTFRFKNKKEFRKNISANINAGSPDEKFLWPLYLTEEKNGTFGYVMELRPQNFSDFSKILNNKARFSSTDVMIESALNIVHAFRTLHRKGLSYQDLNDGNFFIDTKTGDVLICDNDNVTPDGMKNAGNIGGKPGYMAPEIVLGKATPNSLTDSHSLAVILFKLFCRHDPLMGKAYIDSVCITEKRELELYGEKPVFIFDPNNNSNRPVVGVHPNPLKLWPRYPKFLQDAFIKSFCDGMKNPNMRLPENEWQKILIHLQDALLKCPDCTDEVFVSEMPKNKPIQFHCKNSYSYPLTLKFDKYNFPLFPGKKLSACYTSKNSDDYATKTGEVIMNKNNSALWGIKNLSDKTWNFTSKNGEEKEIAKNSVIPIAKDLKINFDGVVGTVCE